MGNVSPFPPGGPPCPDPRSRSRFPWRDTAASRGNHFGDSRKILLPHLGVTVRASTLYWQYWDPRDDRPWIAPQVAAPLTFDAYVAGRARHSRPSNGTSRGRSCSTR